MSSQVSFEDLEHALFWVSSPPEFGAQAFVTRSTGRIYTRSADGPLDEDFPNDIEDGTEYIAVPHKNDLDLGRSLAQRFIDEHAPQAAPEVRDIFWRKGAFARFKSLLAKLRLVDAWHQYENAATASALEGWARDNGFEVVYSPRSTERDA